MKALWVSNAPWASTGYGTQTAQVVPRIAAEGHDIAIAANYGLEGDKTKWEGITVWPKGWESWSNDVVPEFAARHFHGDNPDPRPRDILRRGWIISLMDVWAIKGPGFQEANVATWVPVDHHPAPKLITEWFRQYGAIPIAMAEYGRDMLEAAGFKPLYAPHAIDTTRWAPVPDARNITQFPDDRFVVVMVANNKGRYPSRKSFAESLAAFKVFHSAHPEALLYIHAEATGAANGIDLHAIREAVDLPAEAVAFPNQASLRLGYPDDKMAAVYSSADVFLLPSRGEGFGIPVLEAQACGTPVIVSDATAQRELCGAGWKVGGQPEWDPDQLAWWHVPNIQEIYGALEVAYDHRGDQNLRDKARDFAVGYDCDRVFDIHWRPILAELEDRLPSAAPIHGVSPLRGLPGKAAA